MKRLITLGLMFGNLVEVSSPALIARYNRALEKLTGKRTELPDFHVDISGFSPEIGHELGDDLYLNHNGCNRQFILLTTEQKTAPLLNAQFSMSRDILRRFIVENEAQLFALTARDAVMGELENSVFDVASPAQLLDIRKITIHADTPEAHVADASALETRIRRFHDEPDAWFDDVLIAEMIELAKKTGDVTRNPIVLTEPTFTEEAFWAAHHGGMYVFHDTDPKTVIAVDPSRTGDLPYHTIALSDHAALATFLQDNDLAEQVVTVKGLDSAAILRQKMDFIAVDTATNLGHDLPNDDRRALRKLLQKVRPDLPDAYEGLNDLLKWAEDDGPWPRIGSDHAAYFYALRATNGPQRDLVNQLLAECAPLDVRQLFICHKQLFYQLYADWPDAKKTFVADYLAREYQIDKTGAREALFGPGDPPMETPPPEPVTRRVGPWGAMVRR
ncbi:DUF6638 family protein [Actibacterium sp. 188UL27-1]|uniref:DUF6638 family protein n=1 Tax=Actibacterium sp. 188UL27-1 TaxID=2786961 RepID=UPI00195BDBBD|nr:DUF6638 family protein [Actibacterium sp. 188UL27-1]MBM7066372.1 hypothetical protein [Actibacterium sp. 188UL27-1]